MKLGFLLMATVLSPVDTAKVDELMKRAVPSLDGGASLLLVEDGGHAIYRRAYGNLRFDAVVPIASASKWLSAAAILSLVDEGKLSLDDPAGKFLPSMRGNKARITIRQLMAHTSGLPPYTPCLDTTATTLTACSNEVAAQSLVAEPGASFRYGGASMQVAGRVAEVASGQEWNRLFQERVADPLQMPRTRFEPANPRLGGGAVSALDDLGHFVTMLLNKGRYRGRQVLSESAVEAITSDQTENARLDLNPFTPFTDIDPQVATNRYGIGGWVEHDGTFSSPGSFGCVPWVDPKNHRGGVLLARAQLGPTFRTYVELKRLMR